MNWFKSKAQGVPKVEIKKQVSNSLFENENENLEDYLDNQEKEQEENDLREIEEEYI